MKDRKSALREDVDSYLLIQADIARMEGELDELKKERDLREAAITERMDMLEAKNHTFQDGVTVYKARQVLGNITEKNSSVVRHWLNEMTGDDHPYVEEKLCKEAVMTYVRELLEADRGDEIPEELNVRVRYRARIRGLKNAR